MVAAVRIRLRRAALRDVAAEAGRDHIEVLQTGVDERLVGPQKQASTCAVQDFPFDECHVRRDAGDADAVDRRADGADRPRSVAVQVLDRGLRRHEGDAVGRIEVRCNVHMRLIGARVDDEDADVLAALLHGI